MKLNATTASAVLLSVLILSLASTAFASGTNPPLAGTYKTLTNTVLPGRATESMPCDSCFGQIGNLIMAGSWDGSALGANWKLSCPQVATTPTLLYDGVVGGTGQRIFQAAYAGGTLVGIVSNINFSGSIDGYDDCFTLAISNAEFVGATPSALAVTGPYPAFQGPSDCNLSGTSGTYWDVHDITFSILGRCETSTRTSSWGGLKSMYR